jgi:hypothetical protein
VKVKLWVDDLREPPDLDWFWALDSHLALVHIVMMDQFNYEIPVMSLDHDLGGDDTSRRIILWLCENPGFWPKEVKVHSANPVGREWLEAMIERYKP